MQEEYLRLLIGMSDLLLPLIAGYYVHRFHLISDRTANLLIKFNVIIVYTLQTFLSFWVLPLSWSLILLIPFGACFIFFPGIIAHYTFAKKHRSILDRGSYIMSAMLTNIGTLGGVCAFIIYREEGFAYTQIIASVQTVILVMFCFPLAQFYRSRYENAGVRPSYNFGELISKFFSPNQICVLGIMAGIFLNLHHVERPESFSPIFAFLVHFGAWTALLPVGFLIKFNRTRYYYKRVADLCLLRFIIVPVLCYGAGIMLFPDNQVLLNTLLICALTPTAINAVITSRLYHLNVNLALASFMMTTLIFMVLIFPLIFFVLR